MTIEIDIATKTKYTFLSQ